MIKSVCILVGFSPDSFAHTEEHFISLAISGSFPVIKAGKKESNHLQPQQLGPFLLFALNICSDHTDSLQTDTLLTRDISSKTWI